VNGVWLAIDTATDRASVAAGIPPGASGSASITGARRHAAEIVRLIDHALAAAGVPVAQLAGIAVSDGPGSFTGLRIGWSAAKGLVQEQEITVRAVPAAMAAAVGAATQVGAGAIAVCFDALRGEVFGAMYDVQPERIAALVPPTLLTIAELKTLAPQTPRAVVGDGAIRYAADVTAWCGRAPIPPDQLPLGAESMLALLARGDVGRVIDPTSEPVYGRPAEAQARWEARHGRALPGSTGRGS
jgi:tRNA threonylcarbamoyladenosine biosynthesis protein TsaB